MKFGVQSSPFFLNLKSFLEKKVPRFISLTSFFFKLNCTVIQAMMACDLYCSPLFSSQIGCFCVILQEEQFYLIPQAK